MASSAWKETRPGWQRAAMAVALTLASTGACGGGGQESGDDGGGGDASAADALAGDAGSDARPTDGGLQPFACHDLQLTPAQACNVALTGAVTACSVDQGVPSQNGSLEIRRPDGSKGYLCATSYTAAGGYYFDSDRVHLVESATGCCGGPAGAMLPWPAPQPYFGVPHGPRRIKPWEMAATTGGPIRENPFAIVVASAAGAPAFAEAKVRWQSYGDGQPHPAPDGTGSYYFPPFVQINFLVVPTVGGDPLLVIAPEVSLDPAFDQPLGHPTGGGCVEHGGAPLALIAGEVRGTVLSNHSGRFGHDPSTTPAVLDNTAALFNCYGIQITGVAYEPPEP